MCIKVLHIPLQRESRQAEGENAIARKEMRNHNKKRESAHAVIESQRREDNDDDFESLLSFCTFLIENKAKGI